MISDATDGTHPAASPALISALLCSAALIAVVWLSSGFAGLLYAIIYVVAVLPGLPLGFALFGRAHAAGWVSGVLFGYAALQLALWAVIATGFGSGAAFVGAWLVLACTAWLAHRRWRNAPHIAMPAWTRADTTALFFTLLLVPALMGPPYRNLGRADAPGNRYYRAYFTADFVWHSALAYELGKFDLPPRNPYMAPRTMNYYWTYFLLPASVASTAPAPLNDVQRCLKTNAILAATAMLAALFLVVRAAVVRAGIAAVAVTLAAVAASYEGTYTLLDFTRRDLSYDLLRNLNIDAVTAWRWSGLRVDNMPRSMWYTPQHTTAVALGLIGVLAAISGGAKMPPAGVVGAGVALAFATAMNPFLGAAFCLIYGAVILLDVLLQRGSWRELVSHLLAAVPVAVAVAWGTLSHMADGAGSAVELGFEGFAQNRPVQTLAFSLGPILVPAILGLWPRKVLPLRPVIAAVAGIAVGLVLLYLVRISEASWVGFRAGQILIVSIPILLARALEFLPRMPRWGVVILILAAGLPTTVIDTYNAQDIGNTRPGPGFRWTLWTTPAQHEAFAWIRAHTPETAIVQMDPLVRGREHWTLIPSFAGRRMAAGLPISLLPLPQYEERSEIVGRMYSTADAREAWNIAKRFQIAYVYLDQAEIGAYGQAVEKFDEPRYFERVFSNSEVRIFRVR